MKKIFIFFKENKIAKLDGYYEGISDEDVLSKIENRYHKKAFLSETKNYKEQEEYGSIKGVYFVIDNTKQAMQIISDNEWIVRIKEASKPYPKKQMQFIELARKLREHNVYAPKIDQSGNKDCVNLLESIKKTYPEFNPNKCYAYRFPVK